MLLSRYKSGPLPKTFKIIPTLRDWEEVLYITNPAEWTPQAMYQATRIFTSNLKAKMAQRFFNLILLEKVSFFRGADYLSHFAQLARPNWWPEAIWNQQNLDTIYVKKHSQRLMIVDAMEMQKLHTYINSLDFLFRLQSFLSIGARWHFRNQKTQLSPLHGPQEVLVQTCCLLQGILVAFVWRRRLYLTRGGYYWKCLGQSICTCLALCCCAFKDCWNGVFRCVVVGVCVCWLESISFFSASSVGPNSLFIRILLDKKYALPFKVVDSLVFHYLAFKQDKREMPVLWHQSLLVFSQR